MARRKKVNIGPYTPPPNKPTRYYWCVNCGHHGDYGKLRIRGLECENCKYDSITDYSEQEIKEHDHLTLDRFKRK
jgi:hypothetical protein